MNINWWKKNKSSCNKDNEHWLTCKINRPQLSNLQFFPTLLGNISDTMLGFSKFIGAEQFNFEQISEPLNNN